MTPSPAETLFLQLAAACADTRRCFDRYVGMSQDDAQQACKALRAKAQSCLVSEN